MKKNKILIIIFIVLILLIIISIILINYFNKEKENSNLIKNVKMDENIYDATFQIKKETNVATYITISNCIDTYYNYIKNNDSKGIISVLTNDYIENNNITNNNVFNNVTKVNENCKYDVEEIYIYDRDFLFKTYIVIGKIIDTANNLTIKENYLVNIDTKKRTFQILNLKENNIENIDVKKLEKYEKQIDLNEYNEANIAVGITEKDIAKYYFEKNIFNMLYNTEKAYNMLDKEYAQKRFGNYENFVNYVKNNKENIEKSFILKYKIEEFEDYKEYLCIDNYNNYYIFLEEEPMVYSVLLDNYTVNDEINNKIYKEKDKKGKAQINLDKFKQMLNLKDYESAYNVLNKSFKEKYFKTEQDFEKYIIENLFIINSFEYETITNSEENCYKIKTKIKDNSDTNKENIVKRFKVELLKNNEFAISFDI